MTLHLNPYLGFSGTARAALEFYRDVFGGEVDISTFESIAPELVDPSERSNVMHGRLTTSDGFVLMAADTPASAPHTVGDNISVSLAGDEADKLSDWWAKLSADGTVTVPFVTAPWGDTFGMCVDKFGIHWMVNATSS